MKKLLASIFLCLFSVSVFATTLGSGTIISSEGYVITAAHVVEGEKWVYVVVPTADGGRKVLAAKVLKIDHKHDVALLQVSSGPYKDIPMGTTKEKDTIVTAGYPQPESLFHPLFISDGQVIAYAIEYNATLATNFVDHGQSGGPTFNRYGQFVGEVVAFICPVDDATKALASAYSPVQQFKSFIPQRLFKMPRPDQCGISCITKKYQGQIAMIVVMDAWKIIPVTDINVVYPKEK